MTTEEDRKEFEKKFPVPRWYMWSDTNQDYIFSIDFPTDNQLYLAGEYSGKFKGWQSRTEEIDRLRCALEDIIAFTQNDLPYPSIYLAIVKHAEEALNEN